MANLDLNDLAVFVRVVDRGGFARAARELGVPTSTVSRTVARLEELVGTRLLHRTPRSVRVTTDGRELYESVAPAIATLQRAAHSVEPASRKPKGRLRITAPNDIAHAFVAGVVVDFVERHPLVEVEMVATNRTVNLVDEGFDLALRAGKLADSSLVARKVGDSIMALYASPEYLQRHGTPGTVQELDQHRIAVFRAKGGDDEWTLRSSSSEAHVAVHGRIVGDDFSFLRGVVLSGGGIGLLPQIVCAEDEGEGRLVRVLPEYEMQSAAFLVVYPSARHVPARVTAFRDFVIASFAARVARCKEKEAQLGSINGAARR